MAALVPHTNTVRSVIPFCKVMSLLFSVSISKTSLYYSSHLLPRKGRLVMWFPVSPWEGVYTPVLGQKLIDDCPPPAALLFIVISVSY
jgi:hypothetical protein